jgi:hydrogenase expression/formation protein HypE
MEKLISLAHGDGGELTYRLISELFLRTFGNEEAALMDASFHNIPGSKIAITTDSFVIKPLFFQGGSIGKLAVSGTVNDLAVSGAIPLYLTCSFVIEEGFPMLQLKKIVQDMAEEAHEAGVKIIAGDTKVVERGSADGVYINTTGIGACSKDYGNTLDFREGDSVIVTGTIGDHGIAVLASRGDLGIKVPIVSDCASLNHMLLKVYENTKGVRIARDPTRGGLATALVEIAEDFSIELVIKEELIPVKNQVHGMCDLVGFDPLYLANEGKAVLIVSEKDENRILEHLKEFPEGREAVVIGRVTGTGKGRLLLETLLGAKRLLTRLAGTMLPRIC